MKIVDMRSFLRILIAIVLAIYGHFLVEIYEKLCDVHSVVNRCKDLSHTVEDLDKKRR